MQVARTIYDTLTAPDAEGNIEPFLAESVEGNETFDTWTIKVREGVTFHDGSPLDAQVAANHLAAYPGESEARSPPLSPFLFSQLGRPSARQRVCHSASTPWPP